MYLGENIVLALEGLLSNKMRALLTMLGIIIGIGSVIGIVTVGDSISASVTTEMQSLGATNIMVAVRAKDSEAMGGPMAAMATGTMSENDKISDEMLETFEERYKDSISAVSLSTSGGSGKVKEGNLYANITLTGVNEGFAPANNLNMLNGRFLREGDLKSKRYVAVVSDKLVNNIFQKNEDPLGKEIKLSMNDTINTFVIVGVYKHEEIAMLGMSSASEKDVRTNLYIPATTCNLITGSGSGYPNITVMASEGVDTVAFAADIKSFFNVYYKNNTKYEINTMSMETMMSTVTSMLGTISIAVAVIAAISLVVGGVGVMNIMLVSVTERTREIGTRKALGARNASIRVQFVVEAVIICGIGGLLGILLGVIIGYIGSSLLGFAALPSISIIIIAVLFSMMIGVFFGYYPANKAASLDPIEALRYE